MRAIPVSLIVLATLAAPAAAAPTCLTESGDTARCGTSGAMPVGWTPSPEQLWDRKISQPDGPRASDVLEAVGGIGLLLALIALLPEFDSLHPGSRDDEP